MGLFCRRSVVLHNGDKSDWIIDCDALTDDDLECIAMLLSRKLPPFGSVEGVPRGGLRLAAAMRKYATDNGPLLIVDDVTTTGGSLEKQRDGRWPCRGAVIFARTKNYPEWVTPLFVLQGIKGAYE